MFNSELVNYVVVTGWLNEYKAREYDHTGMLHHASLVDKSSALGLVTDGLFEKIKGLVVYEELEEAALVLEQFKRLGSRSIDSLERGEVWVKCSWVYLALKKWVEAEKAMHTAVIEYPPASHQQAVAFWLLGEVQWQFTGGYPASFENFSRAIEGFEHLRLLAMYDHQPARAQWYAQKMDLLKVSLRERVAKGFFDSAVSLP